MQSAYLNTNLPNFENKNGYYFPKGYGSITAMSMIFNSELVSISLNPALVNQNIYDIRLPNKELAFSVLNDVPIKSKLTRIVNSGIKLKLKSNFYLGLWELESLVGSRFS